MIRNGCLPLDAKIVAALRRSPLSLDAYAWLTYRLARLQHETLIPWRPLEAQFGGIQAPAAVPVDVPQEPRGG